MWRLTAERRNAVLSSLRYRSTADNIAEIYATRSAAIYIEKQISDCWALKLMNAVLIT